jgi:hypothetical protein
VNQTQTHVLQGDLEFVGELIRICSVPMKKDKAGELHQDHVLLHYQLLNISLPGQATEDFALKALKIL